jgi:hypothetical protein
MEEDFSEFLYTKGFNRFEWNYFQDYAPIQAISLIGQYSEQTFEKVMQNVNYLAFRNENQIISYRFKKSEIIKITVISFENTNLDFTKEIPLAKNENATPFSVKLSKEVKPYKKDREKTIFELIELGYIATDDKLHDSLKNFRKVTLN